MNLKRLSFNSFKFKEEINKILKHILLLFIKNLSYYRTRVYSREKSVDKMELLVNFY